VSLIASPYTPAGAASDMSCSIDCKARGFRAGFETIMKSLQDPTKAESIDPRQYRHRVMITMKTSDPRYAEKVNFELWVGTCLWRGSEVIYE
jgi:hypothetical protein